MSALLPIIIGQLISLTGSSMQSMAIPLYILDETHSGLLLSVSQIITIVVTVLFSPVAGVLGDRYNKKKLLIASDLLSGAVVGGLFVLFTLFHVRSLAFIFLCQALCAAAECMLISSLFAIIPDIVPADKITRANAVRGIGTSVALFAGPMIGGFVYKMFDMQLGMQIIFLINAASFLFSAALACAISYKRRTLRTARKLSLMSFARDLKEIVVYLADNAGIRKLALFAVVLNFLSAPVLFVVIPFLINQVFKKTALEYGLIQGFYMVGFFVGGLALSVIRFRDTKALVRPSLLVMAAATLALSLTSLPGAWSAFTGIAVITALVLLIGAGDCVSGTIVQSEIQATARPDIVSRMGGLLNMAFQASIPVGVLVIGFLIDRVELYWVFVPVSALLALFVLLFSGRLFLPAAEAAKAGRSVAE